MHENNEISKIDKFNYLNSLLEGPASHTIQGLSLTEANYDSAVELLQTRFGNPQQIITTHMDELLKLPNCVGDKASSLRLIYDKLLFMFEVYVHWGLTPNNMAVFLYWSLCPRFLMTLD